MKLMVASDLECKDVEDFKSYYISEETIGLFRQHVNLSFPDDEEEVIIEACYTIERSNTVAFDNSPNLYCYLHLFVVCDLGVLVPFSSFEAEVLKAINVAPSEISPNGWRSIMKFGIICRWLEVHPHKNVIFLLWN